MSAGERDGYFNPRAQAALAISLGAQPVGDVVEGELAELLAAAGRPRLTLPVAANVGGATVVVQQYLAPHTLGHYVVFNQEAPRYQYPCFLASVTATDAGMVPAPAHVDAACPGE